MNERELLRRIRERSADLEGRGGVIVGPGDDGAVVCLPRTAVLAVDQLVGGRHFDERTAPLDLVARKAIARNISDLAAMAATPRFALAAGCLPLGFDRADELFESLSRWARSFGCPLVGGDIARGDGPLLLSVTVIGEPHPSRGSVLRSGARAGDRVCVTGSIGGAMTGDPPGHLAFEPRVNEANALAERLGPALTAMIDISDGLGVDAARLGEASGARLALDAEALPLAPDAAGWREAAALGEDYELLFTVTEGSAGLPSSVAGTPVTAIGRVLSLGDLGEYQAGCVVRDDQGEHDAASMGWDHGRGQGPCAPAGSRR